MMPLIKADKEELMKIIDICNSAMYVLMIKNDRKN